MIPARLHTRLATASAASRYPGDFTSHSSDRSTRQSTNTTCVLGRATLNQRIGAGPGFGASRRFLGLMLSLALVTQHVTPDMTSAPISRITQYQDNARHPGELLKIFVLPHLGLSVSQAARDLGVARQTLHRIFDGTAVITPEMALRLEVFCGISAMFWLRLQSAHDICDARASLQQALTEIPQHRLSRVAMKQLGARDGR